MWQEIFEDFKRLRASTPESRLTMSEENVIEDFIDFVDTRSPTLRAPVQTHTTEAIIKDIMDYVNVSLVDEHEVEFERFLRERVFGG